MANWRGEKCTSGALCTPRLSEYAWKVCRKATTRFRKRRTGGVYLTVDGDAATGNRVLELREMMDTEDNVLKEAPAPSIVSKFGKLSLWIRDSVCACSFSVAYSGRKMIGRPHAKNRKMEVCKEQFSPITPWGSRIRYRHGCVNTVACEQISRYSNQHSAAQHMGRANYRAFWGHECIYYNRHVACVRKYKLSLKNSCAFQGD